MAELGAVGDANLGGSGNNESSELNPPIQEPPAANENIELNPSPQEPPAAKAPTAKASAAKTLAAKAPARGKVPDAEDSRESQALASTSTSLTQKRSIEVFSEEGDDSDTMETLDPNQRLLFKKGQKLHDILLSSDHVSEPLNIPEMVTELYKTKPIKIFDEKSATDRINQWKEQESCHEKIQVAAESFNLLHLASLVQIYDDLNNLGEKLKPDPKNNVKNVKSWVISFMRTVLKITAKMEQRNRLGCERLRKLFDKGITSMQLAQAGCRKCDFFVKQKDYDVFLSQIPTLETQKSISLSPRISEIKPNQEIQDSAVPKKKRKVEFKLSLGKEFRDIADQFKGSKYIEYKD